MSILSFNNFILCRGDSVLNRDSLTYIPLFDTTNVRNMDNMFNNCVKVESGALALYQQASTQTNIPDHTDTFTNCGIFTETGAGELEQIPDDWK